MERLCVLKNTESFRRRRRVWVIAATSLNFIAPSDDFFAEDRVLLEASGLAVGGGCPLDVPVAEAEFSHRAKIAAAGEYFAGEDTAEQPA